MTMYVVLKWSKTYKEVFLWEVQTGNHIYIDKKIETLKKFDAFKFQM